MEGKVRHHNSSHHSDIGSNITHTKTVCQHKNCYKGADVRNTQLIHILAERTYKIFSNIRLDYSFIINISYLTTQHINKTNIDKKNLTIQQQC